MFRLTPTVIAIPVFAILIALEAYLSNRRGADHFSDRKDTWINILLGFGSVACGAIFGLFTGLVYLKAYEIAPYKFPAELWWSWVILFFVDDLAYYVFHRASHEIRVLWNFHVVHHTSEQYNLSVAVRQSWFGGVAHWIFYAPIMLLGFAPWMFFLTHSFNLLYQFWIHTKTIRTLGPFEHVLNTPSHHRVHHGVNDEYLDKNYGGVLIIWDRLFGSYIKESEEPRYGIIKPINSYNPLWINTHGWFEMFEAISKSHGIYAKLRCIFGSPNMVPSEPSEQRTATV